jgi:predicted alpha/beta-hydrolase family hydrolase
MQCRIGCGACCIAPSMSSAIPLHPFGKPAALRCLHLDDENTCAIFLQSERPQVCHGFKATPDACGSSSEEALALLSEWETLTAPTK